MAATCSCVVVPSKELGRNSLIPIVLKSDCSIISTVEVTVSCLSNLAWAHVPDVVPSGCGILKSSVNGRILPYQSSPVSNPVYVKVVEYGW